MPKPLSPKPDARPRTMAYYVMWECHCSDVRTDVATLPVVCPGHGRVRVAQPAYDAILSEHVDQHLCADDSATCVTAGSVGA